MKAEKRINSQSILQQTVETEVVTTYGNSIGVSLAPRRVPLAGCEVQIDGYSDDGSVIYLVESWAHVGRAKPGQTKKVLTDVLKLIFVAGRLKRERPDVTVEKRFIFVDDEAASVLRGQSWGAQAARENGITIEVVEIHGDRRAEIAAIQKLQDLRSA